jgi:hypothetical protein
MRAERARESVFRRPADLDAIVARVVAEGQGDGASSSLDATLDDDGDDDYGLGGRRYRDRRSPDAEDLEDLRGEMVVLRMQHHHTQRQLKGALAELALHKQYAEEYKEHLELAEADLCAAHEHVADLSERLETAQEGNRRNAEMAQQLLMHLNTTRLELKRTHAQLGHQQGQGQQQQQQKPADDPTPGSDMPRTMLAPVTHDVSVQAELLRPTDAKTTGPQRGDEVSTSLASVVLLARKHSRDLENVHRELQQRLSPAELQGIALREARPVSAT